MTPAERENRTCSPSQLILYDACPGAWAAQHLPPKEEPTDRSYPLDWGGLHHDVREQYNQACYKKGVPMDLDIVEDIVNYNFWELVWAPKENPRDEEGRPPTIPASDYREFLDVCYRGIRSSGPLDLDNLYGIEEWLWMSVNGYRMRMRPDIMFVRGNQATVPDYKTSRVVMTDAQVKADFKSRCYAAAVMDEENCPQVDAVRVTMDFARYGHTSEAVFTHEDAELVKEETYWR
ncbi:MAG TPA: PD-(D/E)XK nuclease family protein, partial [Thermoguttaceae bacterium]|nr:PD-(D/E)XK nuclease family protein [Thermoguttaceae bacterium]